MSVSANRAIFGELNGAHGLIAWSGDLDLWQSVSAIEMDLPDSAPVGVVWEPFFRGWQTRNFYFFAHTRPDYSARRSGMVRTQVLALRITDAGNMTNLASLFTQLARVWSNQEISSPITLEELDIQANAAGLNIDRPLELVAESLANGYVGQLAVVIPGEDLFANELPRLWRHLPSEIRCALNFGFTFSPADLKSRQLQIACCPTPLKGRWAGSSNLISDTDLSSPISAAGAYLLGLSRGSIISSFASDARLPLPTLTNLRTYERVAIDWEKRLDLGFEGWASILLALVSLAPNAEESTEIKRTCVREVVLKIRPFFSDDILCLRGFKASALGVAVKPLEFGIFSWIGNCLAEISERSINALNEVLKKVLASSGSEWKNAVIEGVRRGFANSTKSSFAVMWGVWSMLTELFVQIAPASLSSNEELWWTSLPDNLPAELGQIVLAWSVEQKWWNLHASVALRILPWQAAMERQLIAEVSEAGMSSIRMIGRAAPLPTLVQFCMGSSDDRVLECTVERCIGHPEVFEDFDPRSGRWVLLLERCIKETKTFIRGIRTARSLLHSLFDFMLEGGGVAAPILDAFGESEVNNILTYAKRPNIWSQIPPRPRVLFLKATALGWFTNYFSSRGVHSEVEPEMRTALFASDIRGSRFPANAPHLVPRGLQFFDSFSDAPAPLFVEWLDAVALGTSRISPSEGQQIIRIIQTKRWENAARAIQRHRRSDFAAVWDAYWESVSWQERLVWRFDTLLALRPNSNDFATDVGDSTAAIALFLTALAVEFNAVRRYLEDVYEKVVENVVYAFGKFRSPGGTIVVVVAQTGTGNVEAAILAERAIKHVRPKFAFFVGIAGGLKSDLKIGDVVVADKVYAYESGKAAANFMPRPKAPLSCFASVQRAEATKRDGKWKNRIKPNPRFDVDAYVKPIAAGEKVIDSHLSEVFALIKGVYGDAYAVAMEEYGFYYALHLNVDVTGVVVRGISDFAESKSTIEKENSQEIAANSAAAFAFEMLAGFIAADLAGHRRP